MKMFSGKVISKKMQKTATVAVERVVVHPIYKKRVRRVKKYHVHDTLGTKVGQKVNFVGCKPYSKTKKWKIVEIISNRSSKGSTGRKKVNTKTRKTHKNTKK